MSRLARALVYSRHGSPQEVLRLESIAETHQQVKSHGKPAPLVRIKFLASPINPSDIGQVEGTYPLQSETGLPAVGGNEGVARVVSLATNDTQLAIGDLVIPSRPCLGTWREAATCEAIDLYKLPRADLPLMQAATLQVNPCTAYLLLKQHCAPTTDQNSATLLVQNGANSAAGIAVLQMAKILGIPTINIIRKKNDDACKEELTALGADMVIDDAELSNLTALKDKIGQRFGQLPNVGFNCIGGSNGSTLTRILRSGGTLVTYGAMSKKPMLVGAGPLIFGDVTLKGFWLSRWYQAQQHELQDAFAQGSNLRDAYAKLEADSASLTFQRKEMMANISDWIMSGRLKSRGTLVPFSEYKRAFESLAFGKQVLDFLCK